MGWMSIILVKIRVHMNSLRKLMAYPRGKIRIIIPSNCPALLWHDRGNNLYNSPFWHENSSIIKLWLILDRVTFWHGNRGSWNFLIKQSNQIFRKLTSSVVRVHSGAKQQQVKIGKYVKF